MKTALGRLALLCLLALTTGCYCCRQHYDPCSGCSYTCKEWGFKIFGNGCDCNGCGEGCQAGCDAGCVTHAPGCEVPCTTGGYGGYDDYAPMPTYQHAPSSDTAPAAPPAAEPDPLPGPGGETAGWVPRNAPSVHPTGYRYR